MPAENLLKNDDYHWWPDKDSVVFQHFHEMAYHTEDRQELLTAINSFLECSVVLPPSEVSGEMLIHSSDMMLRRENEQNNKLLEKQDQVHEEGGESKVLGMINL